MSNACPRLLLTTGLVLTLFACAPKSDASILNDYGGAYNGWKGTAQFNNGVGLSGRIDYAVFTAAAFNANFGGLGYAPADAMVYTYQLFVTGTLSSNAEQVGIFNSASAIGSFKIGLDDVAPTLAKFTPNARWEFGDGSLGSGIASNQTSYVLAFSSPNLPALASSLTFDSSSSKGFAASSPLVPTPGPVAAQEVATPEPASFCIWAAGLVLLRGLAAQRPMFRRYVAS